MTPDFKELLGHVEASNKSRYHGTSKYRKPSRHDEIQWKLVSQLRELGLEVDYEVPCKRLFADVVHYSDADLYIVEIKTDNEAWNAGEVIRQLHVYAEQIDKRGAVRTHLYLLHEGSLRDYEAGLLDGKGIQHVQVDR